ncbi:Uncharacterised protein [BD1-7 clade bacterium]|uniref:Uncharacterized protein n=1 Tax=BD1-7 clade bacterium TaxID=2029982 RepID=A0A5S9Q830_9GAMM|nr:Uncharacterised protein [BD1-7 clade bacterium]CAA0114164.1 Uncharacterised protein [BD1-7 clade bacterium]
MTYKKLAGTSAVFVTANLEGPSPVERDGMIWSSAELHIDQLPEERTPQAAMASPLALEGLEDYDPPAHGDVRHVSSLNADFIFNHAARAWIQCNTSD